MRYGVHGRNRTAISLVHTLPERGPGHVHPPQYDSTTKLSDPSLQGKSVHVFIDDKNQPFTILSLSLSLLKKKRKRKLESDTVSLRSLEDLVGDHFQRKKRLSLPRLSSVSELLSPMCDRVINMLHTTKQSSSANLLNLINHSSNGTANMRRKPSSQQASHGSMSSPNTVKKFRAAWSETCDGEKLKQTMTATEIERQNVLYELFSEEQQMIENLGLAQRVSVRRLPLGGSSASAFV